jgi:hypothetical protein
LRGDLLAGFGVTTYSELLMEPSEMLMRFFAMQQMRIDLGYPPACAIGCEEVRHSYNPAAVADI